MNDVWVCGCGCGCGCKHIYDVYDMCVCVCECTHTHTHTTQAADAEGAGVKEAKTKRARGNTSKQSVDASTSAAGEQVLSDEEEVARLMEQMRGAESGFYLGCPVEVKLSGAFLSVFVFWRLCSVASMICK
jgi:hypothetical protein